MKKTLAIITAMVILLGIASEGFCGTTATVNGGATVTPILDVTASIKRHQDTNNNGLVDTGEPFDNASSMAFGDLVRPTNPDGTPGALHSPYTFRVYLGANSSRRKYKITQVGTALTNGTNTIPNGAYITKTAWAGKKSGTTYVDIVGDTVPASGTTAVGTRTAYTSNASGEAASVEVLFGIPPRKTDGSFQDGQTADVPPDQPGGTAYTSSVTFTIALI